MIICSIVSVQIGAAIAKGGFDLVPPTAFVWLRLLTSSVILMIIARPRLRGRRRSDIAVMIGYGGCLAIMNWSIYQSMARIPLGVAVTVEFLGPLTVAVITSHRLRDLFWVLLAAAGVALLGFTPHGLTLAGVGFAVLAGTAWAGYILFTAETGRRWPGISGLALASSLGAIGLAGPAVAVAGSRLVHPRVLLIGLAVGLLSSVVPYSLELSALRRMPPDVFGILMSLEPAVAALAAAVLLGELLHPTQWLAIGCVVAASVGATWAGSRAAARVASPGGG